MSEFSVQPSTIHALLRRSAALRPHSTAVIDGERSATYAELDAWSDRIAARLTEAGVAIGDRVGLHLDKSLEAIAGLYGVLKAGACYVPLDPHAPLARLRGIAEDCALSALLTGPRRRAGDSLDDITGLKAVIDLAEEPASGPLPLDAGPPLGAEAAAGVGRDDLAYILYTSGSTGRPKGVTLTHGNALAFALWATGEFELSPDDRMSSHAPLHFDLSTFDVFGAAASGAALVLIPQRASVFPLELAQLICDMKLTVWYSVPSALTLLLRQGGLSEDPFPGLRVVLFAGEVFPTPQLRTLTALLPEARLANLYGPTETNVCTWYEVGAAPEGDDPIPIGGAIPGVTTMVIREDGTIAGKGTAGELLVSGPTVMRGYWNDGERTAKVLVPSPLGGTALAYRTGDIVREDEDGVYTFLGRRDHQVKTRGYRVELGDIEAALHSHPAVAECVVVALPDDLVTNRLVACVVRAGEADGRQLSRTCRDRLPSYMMPDRFEFFDAMPRTSTDKMDRRALVELASRRAGERSAELSRLG